MRELLGATIAEASQTVLVDMEASVEHMRRATVRHVESLLVVTEPYFRSLESAGRLIRLARELEIPNILGVANKVRTEEEEAAIRTYLGRLDVEIAAIIPFDEAIGEADLEGLAVLDHRPDAVAVGAIRQLAEQVLM